MSTAPPARRAGRAAAPLALGALAGRGALGAARACPFCDASTAAVGAAGSAAGSSAGPCSISCCRRDLHRTRADHPMSQSFSKGCMDTGFVAH